MSTTTTSSSPPPTTQPAIEETTPKQAPGAPRKKAPPARDEARLTLQDFFPTLNLERDALYRSLATVQTHLVAALAPLWNSAWALFASDVVEGDDEVIFRSKISDVLNAMRKVTYVADGRTYHVSLDVFVHYFANLKRGTAISPPLATFLLTARTPASATQNSRRAVDLLTDALLKLEGSFAECHPSVQAKLCRGTLFGLAAGPVADLDGAARRLSSHTMAVAPERPFDMPYLAWSAWIAAISECLLAPEARHAFVAEMECCVAELKEQFATHVCTVLKDASALDDASRSATDQIAALADETCTTFRYWLMQTLYSRIQAGDVAFDPDCSQTDYFRLGHHIVA